MSNSQGGSPATVNTVNQQHIAEYHSELLAMHGHDMHSFHADWHAQNPDPRRPSRPTRAWGRIFLSVPIFSRCTTKW